MLLPLIGLFGLNHILLLNTGAGHLPGRTAFGLAALHFRPPIGERPDSGHLSGRVPLDCSDVGAGGRGRSIFLGKIQT